ncbi:MAG: arylsulfatase [Proteobacteria bacterium]|nr:arylsulfatase [Pseudomonadota bacterium]
MNPIFRVLRRALAVLLVLPAANAAEPPNVIFVLADDLGYGDHGVHGNPRVKTPNIDRLGGESVRFTDHHVAPVCTPTRSELMTGVSAFRNGGSGTLSGRTTVRLELPMMPQFFKDNGYATAHFGKWHLGDNYPFRPNDRGFDLTFRYNSFGLHSIAGNWENCAFDDLGWRNNEPARFKGYNTDFFFSEAMSWMRQQTKPFFVYLAPTAPHAPLYVEARYEKPYEDLGKLVAAFYGMTTNLDENVGRLVKYLDESGLSKNTILIYMTDNGSAERSGFYTAGMRGTKGSLYEGGHRVPFFIRWPAGLKGGPRDIDALTHSTDLLPTLLDLTGLQVTRPAGFDGHSLKPLLDGGADPLPGRKLVIQFGEEFKKWDSAVLWNKWRLVNGKELYDLATDPGQKIDLAPSRADIVKTMRAYYEQWADATQPLLHPENYFVVGTPVAPVTDLTAEGWFGPRLSDWKYMARINEPSFGYWKIEAAATGDYEVLLYMFPPEANARLNQALRNVPARPVSGARLLIDGKEYTTQTSASATYARFTLPLKQGERHHIEGQFLDAAGKPIVGAFFTRVTRIRN